MIENEPLKLFKYRSQWRMLYLLLNLKKFWMIYFLKISVYEKDDGKYPSWL